MEDINKPVLDQIIAKAFPQIHELKYTFTQYSLNTTYSFKFDNLNHFIEFLQQHQTIGDEETALLNNSLKDLSLQTTSYFFVNFF